MIHTTVIKNVTVAQSTVIGADGKDRGSGLAIQTDPPLESLTEHQVWQLAQAIRNKLEGMPLEVN